MSTKITLIGAGSVVFAKTLLGDILQSPELSDSTIGLMDIDPDRLKVADMMARRMVSQLKVKAKVESTTDRTKAIKGANFVICTVQVGGYHPGTVLDFEIPRKYGLQQTIGDTLGVGGVFRGLRTIPVINGIAQDIARVGAPGCLFLNYTNPMAMNCWAADRAVGVPMVGLCHSVQGTSAQLAGFLGLPYEDISYVVAGVNHMAFFLKFDYRGQDAYPLLFRLLDDPTFHQEKVRFEMMRRAGYFVTESSEHQSEYVPYFIHHGDAVIKQFDIPIDEYLRRCESILATWKASEAELLGEVKGAMEIGPRSHEYGSNIIHSRVTGTPRVIYGNVPNRGLITNLQQGSCVEVPVLVDKNGLQPTVIGDLPPQLAALCATQINVQGLTVEAALTGKREHIYHAVMTDPHASATLTLDKIWSMCDELIEAHQKAGLLGEFHAVKPGTGRSLASLAQVLAEVKGPATLKRAKGEVNLLEVVVTNPGAKAVNVDLRLVPGGRMKLSVPGGGTSTGSVEVTNTADWSGTQNFELTSVGGAPVLCRSLKLYPRAEVSLAGKVIPFALDLAGNPAVRGTLAARGSDLVLTGRVHDSNPTNETAETAPWIGSCLEFFFDRAGGGRITQLFLVPRQGKKAPLLQTRHLAAVPGARATQKLEPNGWDFEVVLPRASLDLEPGADFLFDVNARLTALGDAHSGGHTSLNASFESYQTSQHYWLVKS